MGNDSEEKKWKEQFGTTGVCEACGGKLHFQKVTLDTEEGGKVVVLNDVPAMVCGDCGEYWVSPESIAEMESLSDVAKQHLTRKFPPRSSPNPPSGKLPPEEPPPAKRTIH